MKVKFVDLKQRYEEEKVELLECVDKTLKKGMLILGDGLRDFEEEVESYTGTRHCIGLNSGTDALMMALWSCGVTKDDEVIHPAISFIATTGAIVHVGATPIFAEVDIDGLIDTDKLETKITQKTKAIMPVHWAGRICNMSKIIEICEKYKLVLIEDSAQAIGAKYKGKRVGGLGDAAGFSLHPLKNLGVIGDGGVFTTNEKHLYETVKKLRNHGLKNRDECELWGFNSRLDALQARIASIKLRHLENWNKRFREIADIYRQNLCDLVITPNDLDHEEPVYHNFVIRVEANIRDKLMDFMMNKGVETKIHYPIPIHLQECSKNLGYSIGDFPKTKNFAKEMISLPIYPELENSDLDIVVGTLKEFFN